MNRTVLFLFSLCTTSFLCAQTTPQQLKADKVSTDFVDLSWDKVSDADAYEIYQEGELYKTVKQNKIRVKRLKPHDIYYFYVKAKGTDGTLSANSDTLYVATTESKKQRDERMAWWREARFGMFVHWGPYSAFAGHYSGPTLLNPSPSHPWVETGGKMKDYYSCIRPEWIAADGSIKVNPSTGKPYERLGYSEWIMFDAQIPRDEYLRYTRQHFKAEKFDAAEWVRIAKQAGMKYLVITSKHHDGIALLKTSVGHNIFSDTEIKRDVLRELVDEARKAGLKIGFYYSQVLDWNNPGGMGWVPQNQTPNKQAVYAEKSKYIDELVIPHLKTIINDYKVDVVWWDMGGESTPEFKYRTMKAIKQMPNTSHLIFNNRLEDKMTGDFSTPEQSIPNMPANGDGTDWETCMTLNDNWGYAAHDTRWKTTADVVQKLVDIVSKGGNYLLNIGPKADGTFPKESIDCMVNVGKWMDVNGEAVYATQASPFATQLAWGRATQKAADGKKNLYLHVFEQHWPASGKLAVPALPGKIKNAYLLADAAKRPLGCKPDGDGYLIDVPLSNPGAISTVIVLELN